MPNRSNNFSREVILLLRDRTGGKCSNPGCQIDTVGPSTNDTSRIITGVAAHIKAASPNGPRYDFSQLEEERNSINNAIWLCGNCHIRIDKNNGADCSCDMIYEWKRRAEQAASNRLNKKNSEEKIWGKQFSSLIYINVPRITMLAAQLGYENDCPVDLSESKSLHQYGYELNYILNYFDSILSTLPLLTISLRELLSHADDYIGATVSFREQFYTKNGPEIPNSSQSNFGISSDWNKAPHIYFKAANKKIIIAYDPRWVTTTTAYVQFRNGRVTLSGIGIVKNINENLVFISPLLLGLPKTAWDLGTLMMSTQRRLDIEE